MSSFDLIPAFQEYTDLLFSTDQRCESSGLSDIQATGGTTLTEYLIDVYGLGDATQDLCSQVLTLEISLHQAIGGFTHRYRVVCCQSLDARARIWNLT